MNRYSIFGCYLNMWKRMLDFHGLCPREEYWRAALVQLCILIPLTAAAVVWPVLLVVLIPFGSFGLLSLTSLSLRRLHDAGWSSWWVLLIFTGIGIVLCCCLPTSQYYNIPLLYGPAPDIWKQEPEVDIAQYAPVYGPAPDASEWKRVKQEDDLSNYSLVYGPPPF